jgi:hypothetical protein
MRQQRAALSKKLASMTNQEIVEYFQERLMPMVTKPIDHKTSSSATIKV